MKSKEWVEAAVLFYGYWFFVSDEVREKLVTKTEEFETFCKVSGGMPDDCAQEYKRLTVAKVRAECDGASNEEDFLGGLLAHFLPLAANPVYYQMPELVETESAVRKLLKQGFTPIQIIEIVSRGEGCNSEKVAGILKRVIDTQSDPEQHHCSCGHCSEYEKSNGSCGHCVSAKQTLLVAVMKASVEEQEDALIALLKKKGMPVATIAVVTGLSQEAVLQSKGYRV